MYEDNAISNKPGSGNLRGVHMSQLTKSDDEFEPGYHLTNISKGRLGELSKIQEEVLELEDALIQDCKIMALVEMSDLCGAIYHFLKNKFPSAHFYDLIAAPNKIRPTIHPTRFFEIKDKVAQLELIENASPNKQLLDTLTELVTTINDFLDDYCPSITLEDVLKFNSINERAYARKNKERSRNEIF